MKVELSIRARSDLAAIGDWIARDDEATADAFVAKLLDTCEEIGTRPDAYPLAWSRRTLRKRSFRRYLIFYRIRRGEVIIVAIRHGARDNSRLR